MTSYWKEYLCLTYDDKKEYKIFEGRYKHLVKAHKFYDNEVEDYKLPKFIGREKVFGVHDNLVYGGELYFISNKQTVEFDFPGELNLSNWPEDFQWGAEWEQSINKIKKSIFKF